MEDRIKHLEAELSEERKHSRGLADELAKLADQAQLLHSGSIKQQLGAGEPAHGEEVAIDAEPVDPPAEQPAARPATDLRFRDRLRYLITGKL